MDFHFLCIPSPERGGQPPSPEPYGSPESSKRRNFNRRREQEMKYKVAAVSLMAVAFLGVGAALMTACASDDPPKMTKEELKGRLGDPEVVIVDVRAEGSWAESTTKIKGAVREDPKVVQSWVQKYPKDKTLVFYCS
jgi:hypothetical protein